MSRTYKCAPLPFMGQKRYFVRDFSDVLVRAKDRVDTIVDLFGGSGLLSHTAKRVLPGCKVVYNDYDRYTERLAHVGQTNEILMAVRDRLTALGPNQRLTDRERADVLATVADYGRRLGYVDIMTIGSSLLFSGKWAKTFEELRGHAMYNKVKPGGYDCAGYLDGLEVAHMDYRKLFEREHGNTRALFVLDPPYLTTEVGQYGNYWRLTDYLDVLRLTKGTKYVYFTSDKSQLTELCDWLAREFGEAAPLYGALAQVRTNTLNHRAKFNDMMLTNL